MKNNFDNDDDDYVLTMPAFDFKYKPIIVEILPNTKRTKELRAKKEVEDRIKR